MDTSVCGTSIKLHEVTPIQIKIVVSSGGGRGECNWGGVYKELKLNV